MAFTEIIIPPAFGVGAGGINRATVVRDIIDASAPPPVASVGTRYLIDTNSPSIDSGWGNISLGDIVEYTGTSWSSVTPEEGVTVFVDNKDAFYVFVDDGTPTWVRQDIYDGGFY